jgi:hypothetical protein
VPWPRLAVAGVAILAAALIVVATLFLFSGPTSVGSPPTLPPTPATTKPASMGPGSWTSTTSMLAAHGTHTATLLNDGRVLIAGRCGGSGISAELYEPVSASWSATADMIEPCGGTATLLRDGRVLVAGGTGSGGIPLASAELFDPANGSWSATVAMTVARFGHTATLLPDGKVLVAGGSNETDTLASAELYDPASATWTATGTMDEARSGHTASLLADGIVLVVGPSDRNIFNNLNELYDPTTGSWENTWLSESRRGHSATLLTNGRVLIAGGTGPSGLHSSALASAELYDSATHVWLPAADMIRADAYSGAALLLDGRVIIAGGFMSDVGESIGESIAELYDPVSGSWSAGGSMILALTGSTATLLSDGTVLVAGGTRTGTPSPVAQLYHPGP